MRTSATLAEAVAAELRHAIITGDRVSGERLTELTLAREMNVSQNTIRDALRLLEHDGWVVKQARRGVYVRSFTPGEALEVYALVAAVEAVALDCALETMSKARAIHLRQFLAQARQLGQAHDTAGAIELLFQFHEAIGEGAGKPLTSELLARLYNYVRLLEAIRHARAPRNPRQLEEQISLHESLLRHLETGNGKAAHEALRTMIAAYRALVLPVLE